MTASAAEPSVRNQENSSDPIFSEKSDNTVEGKNISQLLADLYGEESVTPGPKEKLSSIGGYKEYIDSDSTVIYAVEEGRELPDSRSKKLSPAAKYRHLAGRRGERGVRELPDSRSKNLSPAAKYRHLAGRRGERGVRELPDSRSKNLSPAAKYRHLAGRRGERG